MHLRFLNVKLAECANPRNCVLSNIQAITSWINFLWHPLSEFSSLRHYQTHTGQAWKHRLNSPLSWKGLTIRRFVHPAEGRTKRPYHYMFRHIRRQSSKSMQMSASCHCCCKSREPEICRGHLKVSTSPCIHEMIHPVWFEKSVLTDRDCVHL